MKVVQLSIITLFFCLPLVTRSYAQSTEVQYLSGTGNDHTKNWQFYCTEGQNAGKWTTIAVPSCWELQGFGKYDYGFAKDSVRGKEKGLYRQAFAVPVSWKGKAINIVFEGVMTDAEVKINGQLAGPIHQGAFYAFKYDISSLIKYDANNLLEVTVAKHSANASVNAAERHADFWLFGGIFRPVYLEATPQQHILNVAIDAKANGHVTADVFVKGGADRVSMQLYATTGLMYGRIFEAVVDKDGKATINGDYPDPLLWTAETPNLFRAVFTIYSNGRPGHTIAQRFGFRTIEVKERDGVYINGAKIIFKGVNRHSFWPNSGRTTSYGISLKDVQLMKDMNMNAVRMSHYPPDAHFLEVCDSLGLYVMDELTGWHGHYNTETGTKLVHEMLVHDVNHPSIIFWNNGNEGGHNLELDHLFDEGDIQHRQVIHPWMIFRGFDTQHYREYNYGIGNYDHGHNIIMPTEFLHGLFDGGHGAGLEDYWNEMLRNPLYAGGFLWDFADEGVVRTDKDGMIDVDGNHGPDGIVGPYHEKEGSYFTIKEIWSPVFIGLAKEITSAFDGKLIIENRYNFTNTSQCHFTWKLAKFGRRDAGVVAQQKGSIVSPSLAPGQKGVIQVPLPAQWQQYDVLYITATDPNQRELFTWSYPLVRPAAIAATLLPAFKSNKPSLKEQDSLYTITANDVNIEINKNTGLLQKAQAKGNALPFNNGPVIQEAVNNFQGFTSHYDGDTLVISSTFDRKKSYNTLQWTIYPSGIIKMKVNYFPAEYFTSFFGVNFSFPETEIRSVQYMGDGPYRVWKNRMKGTQFGVWNKEYNNTATGESWVYPEFKGYYSRLYWCTFQTTTQPFTVWTEDEDVFLRLFTPKKQDDQYGNEQPLFPSGDISFMQGISGIGTKTQKPETTGPMGMKHIYYDYEKDPARAKELVMYFDFRN